MSDQTAEIVRMVCEQNHISQDKSSIIAKAVGRVLLGFIHAEDLAKEIQNSATLSPQAATTISVDFATRLFTPNKNDLDKVFAPLVDDRELNPKIIQEIKSPRTIASVPTPVSAPKPVASTLPAPKVISETFTATPKLGVTPLASNKNVAAPAPQAPQAAKTDGKEWSKQTTQAPVVKLGAITPGIPSPNTPASGAPKTSTSNSKPLSAPPASPAPAAAPNQPTPAATGRVMSEFERLDLQKKGMATASPRPSTPAPVPVVPTAPIPPSAKAPTPPPAKPSEPAPVIIHESTPMGEQKGNDFRMHIAMQDQLTAAKPQAPASIKSAVVEFGSQTSAANAAKVIHYSEYKSPVPPPVAPTSAGPRQVTEITAPVAPAAQKPFAAPPPPPPPPPSIPAPKGKTIVKDFLGPQK